LQQRRAMTATTRKLPQPRFRVGVSSDGTSAAVECCDVASLGFVGNFHSFRQAHDQAKAGRVQLQQQLSQVAFTRCDLWRHDARGGQIGRRCGVFAACTLSS
jgi:hypothetical protein